MTTGSPPVAPQCATIRQLLDELLAHQASAFETDEHVDACDVVDFLGDWRPRMRAAMGQDCCTLGPAS